MLGFHEIGHVFVYFVTVFAFIKFILKVRLGSINPVHVLVGFVTTMFLDIDHFIDYFLYHGFTFNLHEFLSGSYFEETQHVYVFFHSWEIVLGLCLLLFTVRSINAKRVLQFLALGIGVHLAYDTIYYGFNWYSYFLIIRALNGFSLHVLR